MTRRVILMLITALIGVVILYLSRFWWLSPWSRDGLLGLEALHPAGDLVTRWLRGTMAAPFATVIWAAGVFLALTWVQVLVDRLWPLKGAPHD